MQRQWRLDSQGPGQGQGQGLHLQLLLQVAAKPTIAIKQQQWTQSESSQHMTVKPYKTAVPRVKRIKRKPLH